MYLENKYCVSSVGSQEKKPFKELYASFSFLSCAPSFHTSCKGSKKMNCRVVLNNIDGQFSGTVVPVATVDCCAHARCTRM